MDNLQASVILRSPAQRKKLSVMPVKYCNSHNSFMFKENQLTTSGKGLGKNQGVRARSRQKSGRSTVLFPELKRHLLRDRSLYRTHGHAT